MAVRRITNKDIPLDKHGYLKNIKDWDETVAEEMAAQAGIKLTSAHWEVLKLLRQFHQQSGLVPSTRALVKLMSKELGEGKDKSLYLMRLFPGSPLKLACKIAGLPRPTNCI